jgi:hypothetical protein
VAKNKKILCIKTPIGLRRQATSPNSSAKIRKIKMLYKISFKSRNTRLISSVTV